MSENNEARSEVRAKFLELLKIQPDRVPFLHKGLDIEGIKKLKYKIFSDEQVPLTLQKAALYIDLPKFEGERPIMSSWVSYLYNEMVNGSFNTSIVIIASCWLDGVLYGINGQHTCWARAGMPDSWSPMVREVVYKVESMEQLHALYAAFDRGKGRSANHATRVQLISNPATEGLTTHTVSRVVPGLKMWVYSKPGEIKTITPSQMTAVVSQWEALFQSVGQFVQKHSVAFPVVRRQPVIAAIFETFNKVPTIAPGFWTSVLDGVGLPDRSDARWALKTYLDRHSLARKNSNSEKVAVMSEDMYRICISAWNRWRRNEPVASGGLRVTKERVKAQ